MTKGNAAMKEITIRLAPEMPPEITSIDEAGFASSWYTRLEDLVQVFRAQHKPVLRFLPDHLIATDLESCSVWWRPAACASLSLRTNSETVFVNVPLPGLVLASQKSQALSVVAVKCYGRPGKDTPLFHAPLPNVSERGAVCLGSTEVAAFDPFSEDMPWNAFWGSAFSGHQVAGKSRGFPEDVRLLLLGLDNEPAFPLDDLEPAGITLQEWLGRFARTGGW
jgi:PRTRC genetic system protein B